jgi:predicted O-methyltransferase YrrM
VDVTIKRRAVERLLSFLGLSGYRDAMIDVLLPSPAQARNCQRSMVFSVDGGKTEANEYLVDVAINIARASQTLFLSELRARGGDAQEYISIWPGEHYRLLAGLVQELLPKIVIEIGTATGASALSMLSTLRADGCIVTFDVIPWAEYSGNILAPDDFADGRLLQETDDITRRAGFQKHEQLIRRADLIFIDAAKDGVMEDRILNLLEGTQFSTEPLIVFDDIRLWNMLATWRRITRPKLDLTSFGHWSGTGLVHWTRTET